MVDIVANPEWKAVRILERDEVALGGYGGNMNEQATSLVARTEFLMQEKADTSDIVQGQYSFATLAAFDAVKSTVPANSVVIIDEVGTNQGANTWDGVTLTKSAYDPLTQAINFANDNPLFSPKDVPLGTDINTLGTGFWVVRSDTVAATLTGLPPQLTQPRRGFIFSIRRGTTNYQKFTRDMSVNCEAYERTGNGNEASASGFVWNDYTPAINQSHLTDLENALKAWANSNPKFKSRYLVANEDLNDLPEGVFFASNTVSPTLLNFPAAEMTDPDVAIIFCDKAPNGGMPYQKVIRYTPVNGHVEEIDRLSNGGAPDGAFAWLPWKKKPSTKDIEDLKAKDIDIQQQVNLKPSINCFRNVKLTSEGAVSYRATQRVENGIGIASLGDPSASDASIFYDYEIDNYIFVEGESISFEIEAFTDVVGRVDISIQFYAGSTVLSTTAQANTKVNEFELLRINSLVIPPTTTRIRFRLIRRNGTTIGEFKKPVLISSAWDVKYISAFQTTNPEVLDNLYYVSKSGSDSNKGDAFSPFLTVQKAINSIVASNKTGRVIINDNGWYRESVNNSSDLHIEIVAGRDKRPSIVGSDQLVVTKTADYTKVYQAPLATKPVGMGGARGKPLIAEWGTPYSVILDEDVHSVQRGESYRIPFTPMYEATSLEELDTPDGNGKWWWESGIIYFAATDGSDATLKQYEARVRPCFTHSGGTMYLRGIDFLFSSAGGATFNSTGVVRDDCRVFGSFSNGFSDNANSTMSRFDVAIFNGNDGFNGTVPESATVGTKNAETTIRAVYFEPYGALNGDDGISFHIHGTCNIWGGLFEYNTKAGVVHVTGGGGNCYGTIARGQTNGFYTATPALGSRNKSSMHCHNTIAEKNTYDYRAAGDTDLYCVGTYSDNPTGYGYYQSGTGKIVCKDAKYRGDSAKMKTGNVVVENFETVT